MQNKQQIEEKINFYKSLLSEEIVTCVITGETVYAKVLKVYEDEEKIFVDVKHEQVVWGDVVITHTTLFERKDNNFGNAKHLKKL